MAKTNKAAGDAGSTTQDTTAQGGNDTTQDSGATGFPREVNIVNEGPAQYVVGNKHVIGFTKVPVTVNDADELVRLQADCEALMGLNPQLAELETPPLRIEDAVAAEA